MPVQYHPQFESLSPGLERVFIIIILSGATVVQVSSELTRRFRRRKGHPSIIYHAHPTAFTRKKEKKREKKRKKLAQL